MATMRLRMKQNLLDAADHIEQVGWTQGRYFDGPEEDREVRKTLPCCLLGAVRVTADGNEWCAEDDAAAFLKEVLNVYSISDWNDARGRTKEEVVAVLRAAAEKVEVV